MFQYNFQIISFILLLLQVYITKAYYSLHNGRENSKFFIDEWTVEVEGGQEVAELVALELGYEYGGPVSN